MLSNKGRFILTHCFYTTFISLFIFLFVISAFGEGGVGEIWVDRYDGPGNFDDWAHAITLDDSGNVYVTGNNATIKYLPNGDSAWIRTGYSGADIAVDGSGNVYVTGTSYDSVTSYDYITSKYTPNGDTFWVRRYDGPESGDEFVYALAVDDSGNVYVTGSSGIYPNYHYATIKYSPAGDTLWVRRYHGPVYDSDDYNVPTAIVVDDNGNVYVTGGSYGGATFRDYATIKYAPSGDTLWVRRYNGPVNYNDVAHALALDGSGNLYVTGSRSTIKYLPNGDTGWVRSYGLHATALKIDNSGNGYVTGSSYSSVTNDDYVTIKFSAAGDTLWMRRYGNDLGNPRFDVPTGLAVDDSGNVYVTGQSGSCCSSADYATIKYSSAGDSLWVKRYNDPSNGDDGASAIALDKSGNVYVTGGSYGSDLTHDYVTIKYSPCSAKAGDANNDDNVNLSDIIFLVNLVFNAGLPLSPLCRSDINASGGNPNLSDIIYLVNHIFKGGSAPKNSGVCCL